MITADVAMYSYFRRSRNCPAIEPKRDGKRTC